jgi:hypothetical protein
MTVHEDLYVFLVQFSQGEDSSNMFYVQHSTTGSGGVFVTVKQYGCCDSISSLASFLANACLPIAQAVER